jgi:vacuolar-type H+-ATPase subunit E/Vma4
MAIFRLLGGSNAQICYHNMWIVAKFAPHKRELIALWQVLYEFFNSEEERLDELRVNPDQLFVLVKQATNSSESKENQTTLF